MTNKVKQTIISWVDLNFLKEIAEDLNPDSKIKDDGLWFHNCKDSLRPGLMSFISKLENLKIIKDRSFEEYKTIYFTPLGIEIIKKINNISTPDDLHSLIFKEQLK